ncbi:MAG: 4Fe-4S binding protein [Bacteroidales bacterium]|nr:4Fe-4S binding protein [Bacteroidales bacterium]
MMAFKGTIVIDTENCKGCGVCVTGCPNSCIALGKKVNKKGYNYLELVEEDKCIGCANCAVICPDGVLSVYRAKVD